MSSGLYRLEAFGLNNVWVRYRIAHGALDEPELEPARTRHQLYEDDFGPDGLALAMRIWPELVADHLELDPRKRRRIVAKDRS